MSTSPVEAAVHHNVPVEKVYRIFDVFCVRQRGSEMTQQADIRHATEGKSHRNEIVVIKEAMRAFRKWKCFPAIFPVSLRRVKL